MSNRLEHSLSGFLKKHCDFTRPFLLACSGGPDSLALLHLLQKLRSAMGFTFAVAHIDHSWRPESKDEALQLQKQTEGLQFHLKTLQRSSSKSNLEAMARLERLAFFRQLSHEHGYQAVMLAHHADDQAETVLKRLFENADFFQCVGLRSDTVVDGIRLWRPWLSIEKKRILEWIDENNLKPFLDSTNSDPAYLRARCRQELIPELSQSFGKNIKSSLCHIGQQSEELEEWLKELCEPYLKLVQKGPFGTLLDLSSNFNESPFFIKYLLKQLAKKEGMSFSQPVYGSACEGLLAGKSNRKFAVGNQNLYIDRRRIFLFYQTFPVTSESCVLKLGSQSYGHWQVVVEPVSRDDKEEIGWARVWKGNFAVIVPEGDYRLEPPSMQAPYPGSKSSISRWWNQAKVPALFRQAIPVLWHRDRIHREFLTSRRPPHACENKLLKLSFKICDSV